MISHLVNPKYAQRFLALIASRQILISNSNVSDNTLSMLPLQIKSKLKNPSYTIKFPCTGMPLLLPQHHTLTSPSSECTSVFACILAILLFQPAHAQYSVTSFFLQISGTTKHSKLLEYHPHHTLTGWLQEHPGRRLSTF